jgi:hypothetical protein
MKRAAVSLLLLISLAATAQDYSVLLVPDSLRNNADVVKREEEYILTIKSPAKYTLYEKHVYSILNSTADAYAHYVSRYDQFSRINMVSGTLFNSWGKEIMHSRKSDWKDYSAYDGISLLSDSRYKKNEFYSSEYPYTAAYEEEVENNGTLGFPRWMPQSRPGMSVQLSRFTIMAPADYKLRYRSFNFSGEPVVTQKGGTKTYTWEIRNIPAKKYERSAPSFTEIAAAVIFAPSQFEVQGYKGDMSTWEEYGKFMYQLIRGRDVLPGEIKKKVHELTDRLTSEKEKIEVLYHFLQQNTRYISIQLGIGGWQPFEASYVAEKRYGDCKALSNYMIALLKEAGITGKYIEIYSGNNPPPFIEDFPFSQANHVIACVPMAKDTVWLECTNQTASPGYLGNFTGNRKAILIDENGGRIVQTPVYTVADNLQVRTVHAVADEEGNVTASINSIYTGLQQELPHSLMYDASKEQREKYLNQMFNLPTYQVIRNEYKEHKAAIPSVNESLEIQLNNYAAITGKRFFITPNIFAGATEKPVPDTSRVYDYVIKEAYRDIDSVEIKIPAGYKAETMPKNVSLQTQFGTYSCSVQLEGDKILYHRLMEQNSGRFEASEYDQLVKFYEQVYKADRLKVVLVKPE